MLEWVSTHLAGCGLMGEQGAESIHAKFNSLKRTYSGIRNPIARLKSIMQDHYLSISPHMSAAVPTPEKRRVHNSLALFNVIVIVSTSRTYIIIL